MNKDIQRIVAALRAQGWRVEEGKHYKAYPPDKSQPMIVFAKTPHGGKRGLQNLRAMLRRAGADI